MTPGSSTVNAGATVSFTIQVAHSSQQSAGVNIAVKTGENSETDAGTLTPAAGSGLKSVGGELTHATPKSMSGGNASFSFTWTAPSTPGTYYLRAIGNAVNMNGQSNGDSWNWMTPIAITVTEPTSVEPTLTSIENIAITPNPISDNATVKIELAKDEIMEIVVVNSYGEIVRQLAQNTALHAGSNFIRWNGRNGRDERVAAGMYRIVLRSGNGISSVPVAVVE